MGETHFPLAGEPKPPNTTARERVEALTIYDSQSRQETLLSGPNMATIHAGSVSGAIFTIVMVILAIGTYIIMKGV